MADTNQARKDAVRGAWKNERNQVRSGQGTRDWSPSEQKQIVAKGRANGYEGHHMKSVSAYPQHAGNPKNIQFLNRSEHINGAHKGDTKNATNGYYNPKTGSMQSFGKRNPQAPQPQALSSPITQRQQNNAVKSEQARKAAARQARLESKQSVNKTAPQNTQKPSVQSSKVEQARKQASQQARTESKQPVNKTVQPNKMQGQNTQKSAAPANQSNGNKGIAAVRSKSSNGQSGASSPSRSPNKGISSYQNRSGGQSATSNKSSASGQSSAKGSAGGKSSSAPKGSSGSGASTGGQSR